MAFTQALDNGRSIRRMIRAAVILAFSAVAMVSAQAPEQPALTFEVASVKPSTGDSPGAGWRTPARGTVAITNAPLRSIITRTYGIAFNLERYAFEAPSNTVLSARFDIIATPPADAPPGQTNRPLIDSTRLTGSYEWQLWCSAIQGRGVPSGRTEAMFT